MAIKTSDINQDGIFVTVGKTKGKLLFKWTDELKKIVDKTLSLYASKPTHFFVARKRTPYDPSGFRSIWQRLMRHVIEEGLIEERFRLHDIRRKTATDLENTSNRELVRKLLGHSDQKTTGIYISGTQKVKPLK